MFYNNFKLINCCRCANKVIGTLDLKLNYSHNSVLQKNTNNVPEPKTENTDLEVNTINNV